jgi:hypothetical protein
MLLLGIVIGVGGVFLREVLTQQVSYRRDIEQISPVPVIAEIPANRRKEQPINLVLATYLIFKLRFCGAYAVVWNSYGRRRGLG